MRGGRHDSCLNHQAVALISEISECHHSLQDICQGTKLTASCCLYRIQLGDFLSQGIIQAFLEMCFIKKGLHTLSQLPVLVRESCREATFLRPGSLKDSLLFHGSFWSAQVNRHTANTLSKYQGASMQKQDAATQKRRQLCRATYQAKRTGNGSFQR